MMKPTVKLASLFLAMLMLFSVFASGCTLNKEWSYKTDEKKLAIGIYLTALYESYLEAQNYASELDGYDESSSKWLDMEITDDDGYTAVAKDWIKENAERKCLELLAIEAELKKLDATPDEASISSLETSLENSWYQGLKKTLGNKGVSLESLKYYAARYSSEYQQLFDLFYGENGSKRPSKDEISKYFEENYIQYTYLPVSLYESTTDEASGETKNALSDADVKKITTAVDGMKDTVNKAKDAAAADKASEEALAKYIADNGLTEDAAQTATSVKTKVKTGTKELNEAIKGLAEGKAATVKAGEGESAKYYYVYRCSTAKAKEYLSDETHDTEIIQTMKKMEFREYLAGVIKDIGYEKSKYVGKYQPKMFFEKPKTTDASVVTG